MTSNHHQIEVDSQTFELESLDEYGFAALMDFPEASRSSGVLRLADQSIPVDFRVRENENGLVTCSFANLSLANSEKIRKYIARRQRGFAQSDLETRSYDELAEGLIGVADGGVTTETGIAEARYTSTDDISSNNSTAPSTPSNATTPSNVGGAPAAKSGVKFLAMLLMLFAMVGLAILAVFFLKSRSTLAVANSALVGNYLPINVKADGEIVELLVGEGDSVKQGEILLRLKNPMMEMEKVHCQARLQTAESKVKALKKQLKSFDKKLKVASKKLKLDLEVAKSEAGSAKKLLEAAKGNVDRLKPAFAKGAISQIEFDVAQNEYLAAEAAWIAAKNLIKQIDFSQKSIGDKVLILGDRVDDGLVGLVAELEIAQAEQEEMRSAVKVANNQFKDLDVTAPRAGRIYVTYRQVGEFVKTADETIGLSFDGKVWAAGQVSASQSRRVRPGQPVTVTAPSLGEQFEGVVTAVGHRAMYSQGRYTADFRGETATDVPVKVMIENLPKDIPSGIRLEMAINTGFGIDWLDKTMGYELKPIVNARQKTGNTVAAAAVDATIDQDNAGPRVADAN
jgi:multidrug resistance efflux pump